MQKPSPSISDPSPALDGPDYVALVIEWDELADTLEDGRSTRSGMTTASSYGMPDNTSDWNSVDEASFESFPASDPPAWGSSHAVAEPAAPAYVDEPDEVTVPFGTTAKENEHRWLAYARRIGYGFLALGAMFAFVQGVRRLRHAGAY
jgi:hypothetical protein